MLSALAEHVAIVQRSSLKYVRVENRFLKLLPECKILALTHIKFFVSFLYIQFLFYLTRNVRTQNIHIINYFKLVSCYD